MTASLTIGIQLSFMPICLAETIRKPPTHTLKRMSPMTSMKATTFLNSGSNQVAWRSPVFL